MSPDAPHGWRALARPGASRSLVLGAIGAVVGLAIAGLGLFTARGTRTYGVPAEDVAIVNQVPLLMSDYTGQLRALYDVSLSQASAAQKRQVLNDMIREELRVQRGVELGLQSDTIEVRQALVDAVQAQTAADAVMAQPSEAQLRAYYDRNRAVFAGEGSMQVEDHVLPSGSSPQAVAAAAAALRGGSGADADRIAPRSGRMAGGEEFYFAAKIHLGDRLFAVAKDLAAGQVSAPIMMPDGIHLLVMRQNITPVIAPYAEVRDKVLASYIETQAKVLSAANDRFLRKRADVQIAEGYQ